MVQSAQLSGLVATDNPNEPTRVARHGGFVAGVGFGGHAHVQKYNATFQTYV